jgi:hypothetical protein
MITIFFERSNEVSKIRLFRLISKMYIWLSKSAPEKVFSKKLNFLERKQVFQLKNMFFFAKTGFGSTFYSNQIYIYEIGMKRRIFDTPVAVLEEKSFHLLQCKYCIRKPLV